MSRPLLRPTRRVTRRWVAVLLPGLLLRSLIPVGFMPMFGPGLSVGLMLCPAYAPVPAAAPAADASTDMADMAGMPMAGMDMSTDMSMATPDAQRDARPDHQEHTLCPYAASATLAAPPVFCGVSAPAQPLAQFTLLGSAQVSDFQLLPRAQSARAPPLPLAI